MILLFPEKDTIILQNYFLLKRYFRLNEWTLLLLNY